MLPFDITDKKFATNYYEPDSPPAGEAGHRFLVARLAAGARHEDGRESTPTWWLNYVHFTDQQREGKRPLLFHRWGGLGNHRYQIGFSGDTVSVWPSLAFQPWFTATAANVGYAYWSHDIGGHMPGAVDPELFTRWVQFGAFSPILRTHTTKNPDSERRIWAYPEPFSAILRVYLPASLRAAALHLHRGAAHLRHRRSLSPAALLRLARRLTKPTAARVNTCSATRCWWRPLSPLPTRVSGLASEKVWLPEGEWIEWPTGKHLAGPQAVERSFSIDQTPVYVKAGAIVPMQPPMRYTGEKPVDPLIVNVWPLNAGLQLQLLRL